MLEFLDKYLFLISFCLIVSIFVAINFSSKKQMLFTYSVEISISLALMQLGVFLSFNIYNLWRGGWFHATMTDLCPFLSFWSILIFLNYRHEKSTQVFLKMSMPWLIFSGSLVMLVSPGSFALVSIERGIHLYLRHTLMLIQGIFAYIWIKGYSKKDYFLVLIIPSLLMLWIIFAALIPWLVTGDIRWAIFSAGLLEPATHWTTVSYGNNIIEMHGSYAIMSEVNLPYPVPTILFYSLSVLGAFGLAANKNYYPKYKKAVLKLFNKK